MTPPIDQTQLVAQLRALGVTPGSTLIVHCAFSKLAPLAGDPRNLIDALRDVLGPSGTLVMPSMADDDEQLFDPALSACRAMGIVADTFWRMPGVLRSDSPHAFAAQGPLAAQICAPHPVTIPHGSDSPVGRVYELDGQVLLLGVGQDANTCIHLAENLAGVSYGVTYSSLVLQDGRELRCEYREVDSCCARFALLDAWLAADDLLQRGVVAGAPARLMRARDVVDQARARLVRDATVFLHAARTCDECDQARAG